MGGLFNSKNRKQKKHIFSTFRNFATVRTANDEIIQNKTGLFSILFAFA